MEFAEGLVVLGHGAFALEHVDFNRGLIVGSGRESLALAGRNCGVGLDEFGHHAAEGLDTDRQGHYVEKEHILYVA